MGSENYYFAGTAVLSNRSIEDKAFCVNCAGIVDEIEPFKNNTPRNDYYYLYLQSGKLCMPEGDMLPGDFVIFSPHYPFCYKSDGATSYLWLHFTGGEASKFLDKHAIDIGIIRNIGINRDIINSFEKIFRECIINDERSEEISSSVAKEILLLSKRYVSTEKLKKIPIRSMEYINKNYSREIDILTLAQMEKMGLTQFRSIFKKHTGMSPLDYIISKRINLACRLLNQTNLDISQIAERVGYMDQYYFGRIFKKKMGISPGRYRFK